jgi:hypothetical protein
MSEQLLKLENLVDDFFQKALASTEDQNKKNWINSTYNHTFRVIENVKEIYQELDQELDEKVYAAALCHDIGRLRDKPADWDRSPGEWFQHNNDYHHIFSGEDCFQLLKSAWYDHGSIKEIQDIVVMHGDDSVNNESDLKYRVLQLADKLDKFNADGVKRIYKSRGMMKRGERISEVKRIMEFGLEKAQSYGICEKLVQRKYDQGLKQFKKMKSLLYGLFK